MCDLGTQRLFKKASIGNFDSGVFYQIVWTNYSSQIQTLLGTVVSIKQEADDSGLHY